MYNIHFESTQSRGQRIEEAMNNIAWDDMPADGIGLKEYDAPKTFKNESFSLQKPNIKNSLRAFRDFTEDNHYEQQEEENSLSKKIYDMEIEKSEGDNSNSNNYLNNEEYYEEERKVHVEFQPPTTQKTNFRHITKEERNHYTQAIGHTQNSQDPEYIRKVAKVLQGTKGKQKYSQKNFYPSSSTFILKKQPLADFTQKSTANTNIREDIEDVDDIDEEAGGVYIANVGQKKMKLEAEFYNEGRNQQQQHLLPPPPAFEMPMFKEPEIEKEKGLQDTLERALRRAGNQTTVKWLVNVLKSKITFGVLSVEFVCIDSEDKHPSFAIINSAKQYYALNVSLSKKYYFINPRPLVDQAIERKRVYYVDKVEEA